MKKMEHLHAFSLYRSLHHSCVAQLHRKPGEYRRRHKTKTSRVHLCALYTSVPLSNMLTVELLRRRTTLEYAIKYYQLHLT